MVLRHELGMFFFSPFSASLKSGPLGPVPTNLGEPHCHHYGSTPFSVSREGRTIYGVNDTRDTKVIEIVVSLNPGVTTMVLLLVVTTWERRDEGRKV